MAQEQGLIGRMVGGMIRRTVRARFRRVCWHPPAAQLTAPVIFACNHHGWHDGYLMFHAVTQLELPSVDWIEEFDAFPLFRTVGGMPFPRGDHAARAATIRRTIRLMREESRSLILFADGVLRRPEEPWEFGKALPLIAKKVPGAAVIPVAIRYDMSIHERPEVYLEFGPPTTPEEATQTVQRMLAEMDLSGHWETLAKGTGDVNERWGLNRKA